MSATYGFLKGGNGTSDTKAVTRGGSKYVTSTLQTHDGKLESEVWKDGRFRVVLNGQEIAVGNVNRNEAYLGDACNGNAATSGGEFHPLLDFLGEVQEALDSYKRKTGE